MKKLYKVLGIIFMVMIIGLLFMTCSNPSNDDDDDTVPAELQGTWKGEEVVDENNYEKITIVFTGTTMKITVDAKGEGTPLTATMTCGTPEFTEDVNDIWLKEDYPSGYRINGTITEATGIWENELGSSVLELFDGNNWMYLNTSKDEGIAFGIEMLFEKQ